MRKLHELTWMLAATLVCGASVFTSCSSDSDDNPVINPDEPQQQLADYTIIFYGHGGSNLDAFLMDNIAQFFKADADHRRNVSICAQYKFSTLENLQNSYRDLKTEIDPNDPAQVALVERIKDFYPYGGKTSRFTVDPTVAETDMMATITAHFIGPDNADISRTDSLTRFIDWAARVRPARRYILVLSDHGDGYLPTEEIPVAAAAPSQTRSVIKDDGHNRAHFTAKSLTEAIRQASVHVSAVYCDACLMNAAEYQFELAPVTDYLVLSTFLVPSAGGNYTELVDALSDNPDDPEQALTRFARFCVDAWDKDAEKEDNGEDVPHYHDMSVYRSAEADAFGAELKKFVDRLVDVYQNGTDYARTRIDSITANAYRVDDEQPTYDLMNYIIGLTAALPDDFGPVIEGLADQAYNHYFALQQSSKWLEENGHTVSLSVMLGCQGHFTTVENGLHFRYDADGLVYLFADGQPTSDGLPWGSTLDATYGQLRFERLTGWSRWLKLNRQEPNTKCYTEYYEY